VWSSTNAVGLWVKAISSTSPTGTCLGFHFDRTTADVNGTCFAATTAGIWRSDNGGLEWTELTMPVVGALTAFAGASNKTTDVINLYCAIGTSIYRSTDKGSNWIPLSSITGETLWLFSSDVNTNIVWACQGSTTVRRSTNAGNSWSGGLYKPKVSDTGFNLEHNYFTSWMGQNNGTSFFDATNSAGNPDFLAFTTSMVFMYTTNGGQTWKSAFSVPVVKEEEPIPKSFLNTGMNNTTTWHYYVDPFNSDLQYLCYTDIGFARSVDKGSTWLFWAYWGPNNKLPKNWYLNTYEIAFDPEIPGKMWGAFSGIHDIPNGNVITSDHYTSKTDAEKVGGIGFSSDFAATWEDAGYNTNLPAKPTVSVIVDPSSPKFNRTLYVAQYDQGVFKSIDDGHNWVKKSTGLGSAANMHVVRLQLHPDGTLFCLVTAAYSGSSFSADGVGLYKSTNGGDSWVKINASKNILWPRDFTLNPDNCNEIYIAARAAGSESGGIYKTINGGTNWTTLVSGGNNFGVYLHPTKPGWMYRTLCEGSLAPAIWLSKDNGVTWSGYNKVPHRWIQRVDFDPRDPDIIYVSTFGSSAMRLPADPSDKLEYNWTGSLSGNWNSGANWNTGTIPTANESPSIPDVTNDPIISIAAICNDLEIKSGGKLTIASTGTLDVSGTLTNNAGVEGLVIKSDGSGTGSMKFNTQGVSATVERFMTANKWHLVTAPTNQTIASFLTHPNNSIVPTNGSNRGMMDFNSTDDQWNAYFTNAKSGNTEAGKGYMLRTTSDAAVSFHGILNVGNQSKPLIRNGYRWNNIGNPYTSAIDLSSFLTINAALIDPNYSFIYVWDESQTTPQYTIHNMLLNPFNPQSGQSFFIKALASGSSNVLFNSAMQLHKNTVALKSAMMSSPEIILTAESNGRTASTEIRFIQGASLGLDPGYDAGILKADPSFSLFTRLVEDNGIEFMSQCLPENNFKDLHIPVGLDCKEGGDIQFSAKTMKLLTDCRLILEDKLNKTYTDLSVNTYKTTIKTNTSGSDRFVLHTSSIVLGKSNFQMSKKLRAYCIRNEEIQIDGKVSSKAIAFLYDLQGRLIIKHPMIEGNINMIQLPNLNDGIYLLVVNDLLENQNFKIAVKK
jgi:hypothetical protein